MFLRALRAGGQTTLRCCKNLDFQIWFYQLPYYSKESILNSNWRCVDVDVDVPCNIPELYGESRRKYFFVDLIKENFFVHFERNFFVTSLTGKKASIINVSLRPNFYSNIFVQSKLWRQRRALVLVLTVCTQIMKIEAQEEWKGEKNEGAVMEIAMGSLS